MALQKFTAFALMVLFGAAMIIARPLDGESMDHEGRKLLAQSDDRYNFYKNSDTCKAKSSLMVCKSCTATNLSGVSLSTRDGGFSIWCFDSGDITNNGDGGTDNWQFKGCFTRDGFQGHNVHFTKC